MDIIDTYRYISNVDPTPIMEYLKTVPKEDWDEFDFRQKNFDAHKTTKTLAAVFPDRSAWPEISLETYKHTDNLSELCSQVVQTFPSFYNFRFKVTTAMIVMMPPHSDVGSHADTHRYFGKTHRIHWCLDADYDKMDFFIAGEKVPMKTGDFVEINNRLPHSVKYWGDKPRYNMIIDFLPDLDPQYPPHNISNNS
jgi:hypothetical protein